MAEFPALLNLGRLNGRNGFGFTGWEDYPEYDASGFSVSSAGDINGDGFDDVIIGAYDSDSNGRSSGSSYVVFGRDGGFPKTVDLLKLNGRNGFRLDGSSKDEQSGFAVSSAGDINGDGFDDIIVGTRTAISGLNTAGSAYVVFGHAGGFDRDLGLSSLNGRNGFRLDGVARADNAGYSVSSAGDVNGDGFDDIIVGATGADPNGSSSGSSYVVFGRAGGFDRVLELSSLNGRNGFRLDGVAADDFSGLSVSSAGDVNNDGFDDIIVGSSGASYVVFGRAGGFSRTLDLSRLNGSNGFRLDGGGEVSSAGDINGDGFGDIIVGNPSAGDASDFESEGASYVVFGRANGFSPTLDLESLNGRNGFRIYGGGAFYLGSSVSSAGDVNGDGFDDVIVGAPDGFYGPGRCYVVFGRAGGFPASLDPSSLDGSNGFSVRAPTDIGSAVSSAGDVNGDGFDDLVVGAPSAPAIAGYVIFGQAPDMAVTRNGTNAGNVISGGDFGDTLNGLGGSDVLRGNGGRDTLNGSVGDDVLNGGRGADLMRGSTGDDVYYVDHVGDRIVEQGAGDDLVRASIDYRINARIETAQLMGKADLRLFGSDRDDALYGNRGDNILVGGDGRDLLKGSAGRDTFVFAEAPSQRNLDHIADFRAADDRFRLDDAVFARLDGGVLDADAFRLIGDPKAKVGADDHILYDRDTGSLFYDANGGHADQRVKFAILDNNAVLTNADFVIV